MEGAHRHDDRDPAGQGLAGGRELLAGAGDDHFKTSSNTVCVPARLAVSRASAT